MPLIPSPTDFKSWVFSFDKKKKALGKNRELCGVEKQMKSYEDTDKKVPQTVASPALSVTVNLQS
ncbi:MAG: hypothetical protein CMI53_02065 [Parcubacteria group bacterium]|nr:hypothetical protein [Parcubacteria group bacterium]